MLISQSMKVMNFFFWLCAMLLAQMVLERLQIQLFSGVKVFKKHYRRAEIRNYPPWGCFWVRAISLRLLPEIVVALETKFLASIHIPATAGLRRKTPLFHFMTEGARIFFGILIRLYHGDHNPPHLHATYGEFEAIIEIKTGKLLEGRLPPKALKLVQ